MPPWRPPSGIGRTATTPARFASRRTGTLDRAFVGRNCSPSPRASRHFCLPFKRRHKHPHRPFDLSPPLRHVADYIANLPMSATASAGSPNSVLLWKDAVIHFVARTPPGRRQEEAAGVPRAHSGARERPFRARFAPTSDVRSTATASPGGKGDKGLARKRVFISFDYDNDRDLPGNLVAQARESASPFGPSSPASRCACVASTRRRRAAARSATPRASRRASGDSLHRTGRRRGGNDPGARSEVGEVGRPGHCRPRARRPPALRHPDRSRARTALRRQETSRMVPVACTAFLDHYAPGSYTCFDELRGKSCEKLAPQYPHGF